MKNILIVDDDEDIRNYLKVVFENEGFLVSMANNGLEALEVAWMSPPSLIMSDVLMPVMDGFRLCKEWKSDERLKGIPFVFYTSSLTEKRDEELAVDLGTDLFVTKTKRPEELLSLIRGVMERHEIITTVEAKKEGRTADAAPERYSDVLFRKLEQKTAELEQMNLTLGESERKYRSIFDNSTEGIYRTTNDGRFLMANPAFYRMLGYESFEELMESITDIGRQLYVDPGEHSRLLVMLGKSENSIVTGFQTEFRKKGGETIWVRTNIHVIKDEQGNILCYEGMVEDITHQKRIEDTLTAEKQRFNSLLENAPFGLVMIDLEGRFTYLNPRFKEMFGYELNDIPNGREWFRKAYPDGDYRKKVISTWKEDLDRAKPGQKRPRIFTVTHKDKSKKVINFIPFQLATGETVMSCDDITARVTAEEEAERQTRRLKKAMLGTIHAIASMVELRDPYTAGHQKRVARIAVAIAEEMGLSKKQIEGITVSGTIHDVGKIYIPAEILSKPGRLSSVEMSILKTHAQAGFEIIKDIDFPWPIRKAILQHHERIDGSGYPNGLKGDEIVIEAKIIAVADVVEAMGSHRPYRASLGIEQALREIESNKGTLYDLTVADACLKLFREKGLSIQWADADG